MAKSITTDTKDLALLPPRILSGVVAVDMFADDDNKPAYYGYIRGETPNNREILRLRNAIVYHCLRHGLRLKEIIHDWGAEKHRIVYPGLTIVTSHLEEPETDGIILAELSDDECTSIELKVIGRSMRKIAPTKEIVVLPNVTKSEEN